MNLVKLFLFSHFGVLGASAIHLALPPHAAAADNELTEQEKKDGWVLLFDGKTPAGWHSGGRALDSAHVRDDALNPHGAAAYVTFHERKFSDFVLSCDFRITKGGNSGVFFRTGDPNEAVQTGIEFQILDSAGKEKPDRNDGGAIYDVLAPSKNAMKPAGEWNHVEITAVKNRIKVVLNGQEVIGMDLDRWTQAGKNPDGSENKFKTAYKDMPREGLIGLQDHKSPVWFKNIKIKPAKEYFGKRYDRA
jgi:hypothetical protein